MTTGTADLETLYADEHHRLERFLVQRGLPAAAAADLVQDAFMRLLRTPREEVRDPRSYLFRTAGNLAIDTARHERRVSAVMREDEAAEDVGDPAPLQDAALISRQELDALQAALGSLPPRAREVLVLHKLDGLSYAEIAVRLGISKNTVMAHMVKAMGALRLRFGANSSSPH
jgi:RNA polymerase sigma factor (sigma-70 family)